MEILTQACEECLGFLGGFSWTLLVAWSCTFYNKRDKNIEKNIESLLVNFFQRLNEYDGSQPIALTEIGREYKLELPRDRFAIVSSIDPCQNSARNVTKSTLEILRGEFSRGITLAIQSDWECLFEPINLQQESDIYLVLQLNSQDQEELEKNCGILESHIIGLVIQLEQINIFVRPWTGVKKEENTASIILGLILPQNSDINSYINSDINKVEQLSENFVSQFNLATVSIMTNPSFVVAL